MELVTRSRTEHLSDQDKSKSKGTHSHTQNTVFNLFIVYIHPHFGSTPPVLPGTKTPLQSFLGIAEQHTAHNGVSFTKRHLEVMVYVVDRCFDGLTGGRANWCVCLSPRVMCVSMPAPITPQPSQLRNTLTQSSNSMNETSDAPWSSPAKSRGTAVAMATESRDHRRHAWTSTISPPCLMQVSLFFSLCLSLSLGLRPICG